MKIGLLLFITVSGVFLLILFGYVFKYPGADDNLQSVPYIKDIGTIQNLTTARKKGSNLRTARKKGSNLKTATKKESYLTTARETGDQRYDILISSYMRSGSSYTHRTLHVDDVFAITEPLHHSYTWKFHDKEKLCSYTKPTCERDKGIEYQASLAYLDDIYTCKIRKNSDRIDNVMAFGSRWYWYKNCPRKQLVIPECLAEAEKMCKTTNHRLTKVIRMTVRGLEPLLQKHRKLKMIHLFRDPRGIMSSHIFSGFYPVTLKNVEGLTLDIQALCNRMLNDIQSGKEMMIKYPDRFRFIQYEDIAYNTSRLKAIYEYFGMNITNIPKTDPRKILNTTQIVNKVFGYRKKIPFDNVKLIDTHCKEVYQELGYKMFETKKDYENMKISPVIKLAYAIK